jgi:hypothetical protein
MVARLLANAHPRFTKNAKKQPTSADECKTRNGNVRLETIQRGCEGVTGVSPAIVLT